MVLLIYSGLYKERAVRNAFLFAASLFFYWKTSGLFFLILVFSTVSDFYLGNLIHHSQKKGWKKFGVIMSVVVNLVPTTGITLPLISYGGSSLVATCAAIGVLLNISQHS